MNMQKLHGKTHFLATATIAKYKAFDEVRAKGVAIATF